MAFHLGSGDADYTIEHIYPQSSSTWVPEIMKWGADAAKMNKVLHTLGNLTVVTSLHNREVANGTFAQKQKHPHIPGKVAPLTLNDDWLSAGHWTDAEIRGRTTRLVDEALKYWRP